MAVSPFSLSDLGVVLACRIPKGRDHAAKLDGTLRAAKTLAEIANLAGRTLSREYGAPGHSPWSAWDVVEAGAKVGRPSDELCAGAGETLKVLASHLPGAESQGRIQSLIRELRASSRSAP